MKKLHFYQSILFLLFFIVLFLMKKDLFSFSFGFFIGHFYMLSLFQTAKNFFLKKKFSTFSIILFKCLFIGGLFTGILSFLDVILFMIGLFSMISFCLFLGFLKHLDFGV